MLKLFYRLLFLFLLLAPAFASAEVTGQSPRAVTGQSPDGVTIENPLPYGSIPEVLDRIIDFLALLAAPIAVLMLVWAAYLFVLAGTSLDNVKKAKSIILWVVVGLMVLGLSKAIVYVTCSVIGVDCSP